MTLKLEIAEDIETKMEGEDKQILVDHKTPTLCLNMIVKNESKVITRLMESVIPIIDCYCICDTGSTDNTVEIIETYFKSKNIPGKIVKEPFKNFSHNRNIALQSCVGMSDYVLFLDADMILEHRAPFDKNLLYQGEMFTILQGCNEFYYENSRIVKNNGLFKYQCVTHEYLDVPPNSRLKNIDKSLLFILDVGDGGSKHDKYERDVRLLTDGIKEEPNNVRYYFYLANSYHDCGQYENAIETYKKRIELGGWNQEVWYSYYRIGMCYKFLSKMPEAINAWLEGYNFLPERIENIYEILNYYRLTSKYTLAQLFYTIAKKVCDVENVNRDRYLFLHNEIYTFRIDYEFTIIALYLGINNINKEIVKVLNCCNDNNIKQNVIFNFKYYKDIWVPKKLLDLSSKSVRVWNGETINLSSSSSCIIKNSFSCGGGYIMNVRYVNYEINEQGFYLNCDKNIITFNKLVKLNNNFEPIVEKWFDNDTKDRRYVGIEDVRIFSEINLEKESEKLLFIGTGFHENNKIGIVHGKYSTDLLNNNPLSSIEITPSFVQTECEKNWVFVDYNGSTHIIYNWFPLIISKVNEENKGLLDMKETRNMPNIFKNVRGSTNGCNFGDEIWFVTHIVSYEQPRHYYNMVVVFDLSLNLKRYSAPFKFSDQPIEYCLGLVVEEEQVIMTYSVWDRSTMVAIYDKSYINERTVFTI